MTNVTESQKPGDVVGKYEIVRFLGEGSMGIVWVAKHTVTEAEVALKILPEHKDEAAAERFSREVTASTKVKHPGVVKVFDAGHLPDGRPFIAMELLEGESLDDLMEREHENRGKLLDVVFQILEPLGAAHEHGIVHRDLKPENIFIAKDEQRNERAKILDFGIARDSSASKSATQIGIALGTPWYMSPEQATSPSGVGPASDIWSIGVMMYEILSGEPPFDGESVQSVIIQACTEPHIPIAKKCPEVFPALCELVEKCLSKDPSLRPQNGRQLLENLSYILTDPQVQASLSTKKVRSLSPSYPEIAFSESSSIDSSPEVPTLDVESWKKQEVAELQRLKKATGITSASSKNRWVWGGVVALGAGIAAGVVVFGMSHPQKRKKEKTAQPVQIVEEPVREMLELEIPEDTETSNQDTEIGAKSQPKRNETIESKTVSKRSSVKAPTKPKQTKTTSSRNHVDDSETDVQNSSPQLRVDSTSVKKEKKSGDVLNKSGSPKDTSTPLSTETSNDDRTIQTTNSKLDDSDDTKKPETLSKKQDEPQTEKKVHGSETPPSPSTAPKVTHKKPKSVSKSENENSAPKQKRIISKKPPKPKKKIRKKKIKKKTSNKSVPFVTF